METKEALHLEVGMTTQQVLHMNAGLGDTSYANNSLIQKKAMSKAKPILEEGITRLYCSIVPECLKVADLGCSSGPNTLQLVYDIINIVDTTSRSLNLKLPIFQFFLNDLFGNDFNTLFNSLPRFFETLQEKKGPGFSPCFINATPGNFYTSLFPNNSIHFFHSSYCLHWLSQAPKGLDNKDNIYFTRTSPPSMHKAYLAQFQHDFSLFLKSRLEELVPGGGMVVTLVGRDEASEESTCYWALIGMILNDMVLENLIEAIKLESFNMPYYEPTIEEAKQVIEEEGSFTLHRLETIMNRDADINEGDDNDNDNKIDENMRGEFIATSYRAILEPLLKAQFGAKIMDELFLRFKNKVVEMFMEVATSEYPSLVISLIKNA